MYTISLTAEERRAFDWIGDRYTTGDAVSRLLCECMGEDDEWSQDGDITFRVPEHMAWQIAELAEAEDGLWPCFAAALRNKMQSFVEAIV